MTDRKDAIKLNKTLPHPGGADVEWPETTPEFDKAMLELTHNAMQALMKHSLVPSFAQVHQGRTRAVVKSIAVLMAAEIANIIHTNMVPGQDDVNQIDLWNDVEACFGAVIDIARTQALMRAMGFSNEQIDSGDVNIIII